MIIGATHNGYIAPKGWKPKNPDENYVITYLDIELADGIEMNKFEDIAATCAAESSIGTWEDIYSGRDSGVRLADKLKAVAFDLEPETKTFKIAYKKELFEKDNMSAILATVVGNIDGMKMLKAFRCLDIRFPREIIQAFPGPQYGIEGMREILHIDEGPLLCTVPQPKLGRTAKEQAKLAEILFAAGMGEYHGIKDDENLTNQSFNPFDERCELIHKVIREIEKKSGKKKFYLCNVTHSNLDTMIERADKIKAQGGRWMMMDIVTTGFSAIQTMRLKNPGLAIHAHRAMNSIFDRESGIGVYDKGEIKDFSMSMVVTAKIMRMLGVDSLQGGAPYANMDNYGEPKLIRDALQLDITPESSMTLGQYWYGMRPVWHVASGGLHPGNISEVIHQLGEDIILQTDVGVLGHPWGIEAGAEAMIQAKDVAIGRNNMDQWILEHPDSALAKAAYHWKFGSKIGQA